MNFKFLVSVVCLANIRLSGAAFTVTPATGTATIDTCQSSGANVSYTKPKGTGGIGTYTFLATLTQTPTTTPALFAVDAKGNVTIKATSSTFQESSYTLALTMQDSTPTTPLTASFTLAVKVSTADCSSVDVMIPSLTVICICLISLLLKNN